MSIALSLAKENSVELNFEKILYPVGVRESQKGQRLYAALSKLGKTFVTTNYMSGSTKPSIHPRHPLSLCPAYREQRSPPGPSSTRLMIWSSIILRGRIPSFASTVPCESLRA